MLSVSDFNQLFNIIEEKGGQWIVKDPKSGIYVFTSPDANRFKSLRNPEMAAEYFKFVNKPDTENYDFISRIGIRNGVYYPHYKSDVKHNVFLKNDTIQRLVQALENEHKPNKSNINLFNNLLNQKNEQIRRYNEETGNNLPLLNNFTNWQAAIIQTNRVNGHNPADVIKNDSRILKGDTNNIMIPFDTVMPNYATQLANSEADIKNKDAITRKYKSI